VLPDESDEKPEIPRPDDGSAQPAPASAAEASALPAPSEDHGVVPDPAFAADDPAAAPLAAVFKRRKGSPGATTGSRRASRRNTDSVELELAQARAESPAVQSDAGGYDVVLTDAFRVDDAPRGPSDGGALPPVVAQAPPSPPPVASPPRPEPPPPPVAAPTSAAPRLETPTPDADESIEIPDDTEPAARIALPDNAVDLDPALAVDTILSLARKSATVRRTPTAGAWFAELFGNDYFLAHPQRLGPSTAAEVTLIESALKLGAGARVLDLCCGYGRHTVPMAAKGYEVVGLDLSLDMLKAALGRAQANALAIKFVHGDMRDLNFRDVFDGIYCFDSSFGFFTEPENLMVLRGVHDALKRGGRFILDVANRDYALRGIPTRNWWEGDGCLVQEDIEFDHLTSRLAIKRFAVFADGMQREYNISMRLYALHELVRMIQMVGFEVREISGSRHTPGAFFGPESNRIILTAEKVGPRV
jgi:SAM-dependent methyltransferase